MTVAGMSLLDDLQVWIDPVRRPGPEAMAVDEWLLETVKTPVLRVYGWSGEWGTVGYFGKIGEARAGFPGVEWVRRWTGGGTVDHRNDWTYTLVAPCGEPLVALRGAESYRAIHSAVAEALREEGMATRLSSGAEETGASACFENPVSHDIVGEAGRKIAGAGQRRSRRGLLHQGSVRGGCELEESKKRAGFLASKLATNWRHCELHPPDSGIAELVRTRYTLKSWTERR